MPNNCAMMIPALDSTEAEERFSLLTRIEPHAVTHGAEVPFTPGENSKQNFRTGVICLQQKNCLAVFPQK
jgi:hypothetical protein